MIEKVHFHTKDADLSSSITKKSSFFLSSKSEAKILNFAFFWGGREKWSKKHEDSEVRKK